MKLKLFPISSGFSYLKYRWHMMYIWVFSGGDFLFSFFRIIWCLFFWVFRVNLYMVFPAFGYLQTKKFWIKYLHYSNLIFCHFLLSSFFTFYLLSNKSIHDVNDSVNMSTWFFQLFFMLFIVVSARKAYGRLCLSAFCFCGLRVRVM